VPLVAERSKGVEKTSQWVILLDGHHFERGSASIPSSVGDGSLKPATRVNFRLRKLLG
jgi:hypothetical protein